MSDPVFITTKEAADLLRVSQREIQYLCKRGKIRHVKVGKLYRIDKQALLGAK